MDAHLTGQTAFVVGEKDICASAKVLKTFSAEFERPKIRAAILDNSVLDTAQVIALADLPSKEALQAQLLGYSCSQRQALCALLMSQVQASLVFSKPKSRPRKAQLSKYSVQQ